MGTASGPVVPPIRSVAPIASRPGLPGIAVRNACGSWRDYVEEDMRLAGRAEELLAAASDGGVPDDCRSRWGASMSARTRSTSAVSTLTASCPGLGLSTRGWPTTDPVRHGATCCSSKHRRASGRRTLPTRGARSRSVDHRVLQGDHYAVLTEPNVTEVVTGHESSRAQLPDGDPTRCNHPSGRGRGGVAPPSRVGRIFMATGLGLPSPPPVARSVTSSPQRPALAIVGKREARMILG